MMFLTVLGFSSMSMAALYLTLTSVSFKYDMYSIQRQCELDIIRSGSRETPLISSKRTGRPVWRVKFSLV